MLSFMWILVITVFVSIHSIFSSVLITDMKNQTTDFSSLGDSIYYNEVPREEYNSTNCWTWMLYTLSWTLITEKTGSWEVTIVIPKIFIPEENTASWVLSYNDWIDSYSWTLNDCISEIDALNPDNWIEHTSYTSSWMILRFGSWGTNNMYLWKNILNETTKLLK